MRQINAAGIALIKRHEGLHLEAVLAPDGEIRVGYGHTAHGLRLGSRISAEEADKLLLSDLSWIEEAVLHRVKVELNDNEFSALVSLVFDIGIRRFTDSALFSFLNKEEKARAAEAMIWLEQPEIRNLEVAPAGTSTRRQMEQALFLDSPQHA